MGVVIFTVVFSMPLFVHASITLVQNNINQSCSGSVLTCNVQVSSTAAGDALVVMTISGGVGSATNVTSTADTGSLVNCASCYFSQLANSSGYLTSAVWYSTSTPAGITSITSTISQVQNFVSDWWMSVWVYSTTNGDGFLLDNASTTASLSGADNASYPGATTVPLSGSNDIIDQGMFIAFNGAPTAINDSYTNFAGSSNYGVANLVNTSNGSAPTWTLNLSQNSELSVGIALKENDATPPFVTWISPSGNAVVSSTITLTASSTDNAAVSSTAFYYGAYGATFASSTFIGSTSTPSGTLYSFPWDTNTIVDGSSTLWVLATDMSNNTSTASITVNVENAPSITWISPAPNATVSSTITLTVSSTDSTAIQGVQFQIDGTNLGSEITATSGPTLYSTTWNTTQSSNGSHIISAIAYDTSNNSSTATSSVTVGNISQSNNTPTLIHVGVASAYGLPNYLIASNVSNPTSSESTTSTMASTSSLSSMASVIAGFRAELQSLMAEAESQTTPFSFIRNLSLWSRGSDVQALQQFFIEQDKGPSAEKLKAHGTTQVFGYLTFNALKEYQTSVGLPATGYFGMMTRNQLMNADP